MGLKPSPQDPSSFICTSCISDLLRHRLNARTTQWMMWQIDVKKDWQGVSMQMIVIFNSFSDTACPNSTFYTTQQPTVFKAIHFLERKLYNFDQEKMCCISQGSAAKFLRCGGQTQNHLCQIYSGFSVPKIIKISSFLTKLFKKYYRWAFFKTQCTLITQKHIQLFHNLC